MDTTLPLEEPKITLPLSLYLTRSLVANTLEWVEITFVEATILTNFSSTNERLYHIELPSTDNALTRPVLWNLKAWRESSLKKQRAVAAAAHAKRAYTALRNNRNTLMLKLEDMLQMPEEDLLETATRIVCKHSHALLTMFATELEDMSFVTDDDRAAFGATIILKPKGGDYDSKPIKYWR